MACERRIATTPSRTLAVVGASLKTTWGGWVSARAVAGGATAGQSGAGDQRRRGSHVEAESTRAWVVGRPARSTEALVNLWYKWPSSLAS